MRTIQFIISLILLHLVISLCDKVSLFNIFVKKNRTKYGFINKCGNDLSVFSKGSKVVLILLFKRHQY